MKKKFIDLNYKKSSYVIKKCLDKKTSKWNKKNLQQTNIEQNKSGILQSNKIDFKVQNYQAIKTFLCGAAVDK